MLVYQLENTGMTPSRVKIWSKCSEREKTNTHGKKISDSETIPVNYTCIKPVTRHIFVLCI